MFMYLYYIIFKSCYRVPSIKQYNSTLFFVFAFISTVILKWSVEQKLQGSILYDYVELIVSGGLSLKC